MEKRKYIILADGTAEVFWTRAIHAIVAGGRKVISAGFVDFDDKDFALRVYGESTTLGIKSRPEDLQIIRKTFSE